MFVSILLCLLFQSFEFLILDDGSTQADTVGVLDQHASEDGRIRLIRYSKNRGILATLRDGIKAARTNFIVRMDSDDIAMKERLEKQYQFMSANTEIGVLGTAVEIFKDDDTSHSASSVSPSSSSSSPSPSSSSRIIQHPTSVGAVSWSLSFYCSIAHPTVMLRRDICCRNNSGLYSNGWMHAEDYEAWLRLDREGVKMANVCQRREQNGGPIGPKAVIVSMRILCSCLLVASFSDLQLPDVLLRLRKHSANISSLARSSHIQHLHSRMAVQFHLTAMLQAPVAIEYVEGLIHPSRVKTIGELTTLAYLLLAIEQAVLAKVPADNHAAIRKDCTARLGELATIGMRLSDQPAADVSSSSPAIYGDIVPSGSLPSWFTLPSPNSSSSTLMSMWMKRGTDAASLLAKMMMAGK